MNASDFVKRYREQNYASSDESVVPLADESFREEIYQIAENAEENYTGFLSVLGVLCGGFDLSSLEIRNNHERRT